MLFGEAETYWLFHPALAPLRRAGKLDEIFNTVGLTAFWAKVGRPPL